MFDPRRPEDLDSFKKGFPIFVKKLSLLLNKRLTRCRGTDEKEMELVFHFIWARAMAEHLVDVVVTDENEQFLREATDLIKVEFGEK